MSRALAIQKRAAAYALARQTGYCGYGVCRCGSQAYLVGRSYEGKRCERCWMEPSKRREARQLSII